MQGRLHPKFLQRGREIELNASETKEWKGYNQKKKEEEEGEKERKKKKEKKKVEKKKRKMKKKEEEEKWKKKKRESIENRMLEQFRTTCINKDCPRQSETQVWTR
ncbi:UPF0329 protein ECU05_1680/ECU11_0050-like [Lutra lutra]|uniref:UPF0329 protein ECU05_1680/ECU11_0050-like n=1 Tax=Lutra lutra TaxID=9657 RepID=UPI001FD49D59|nr:UPF0329 protein ECU05_1680/ECU11_0050-like [Lutra lutra]